MTKKIIEEQEYGPWKPGIQSQLPSKYLPLSTMFRPENVFTSIDTARELSDFTGLPMHQLVRFRPQRLVVHELLIRVSADFFVSDGSKYADLGVNFRKIVATILCEYINPHMSEIVQKFDDLTVQIRSSVEAELARDLFAKPVNPQNNPKSFKLMQFFKTRKRTDRKKSFESAELHEQQILATWRRKAETLNDPVNISIYLALAKIASAITIKHGRLRGDKTLLTTLVSSLVCNDCGSELIGEIIAPYIRNAAKREGYIILPAQVQPVVINIKGASAAGKSTMRPLQRKHAEQLGLNWHDFALISPDIWRKFLLDYASLDQAYKYAGTLTGDEVPVIDQKLDRYMSKKAESGQTSHLLIDRFRFDSFAPGPDTEEGSNLLTRFGHVIYLMFMITPPEATVERAWKRGLQVGRYKAVDDLLDHNIEAYTGIPVLFFTWALRKDKSVHYEFLDNSVPEGQRPQTIAFGSNDEMNILDFKCMLDIDRYIKIDINADNRSQVYPDEQSMAAEHNTDFLMQCARKIPQINFIDRDTAQIYARMESGIIIWVNPEVFKRAIKDQQTRAGFLALAPEIVNESRQVPIRPAKTLNSCRHTMGDWGRPVALDSGIG